MWVAPEGVFEVGDNGKLQTEGGPGLAGLTGVWSLAQKFGAIFRRSAVVERTVRTTGVVIVAEAPGETLRFEHAGEQLTVEAFVAESTVEAFIDSVLPRTGRLDEPRGNARRAQPRLKMLGDELGAIVAAQVAWWPM